jgi:uncharacterized alkaline shock family protein YloU
MTLVHRTATGSVTVPDSVLEKIVACAAESVDGVRVRRKRSVDVDAKTVRLELSAQRGRVLPEAGAAVQEAVAGALAQMCGLDPARVDLAFEELA